MKFVGIITILIVGLLFVSFLAVPVHSLVKQKSHLSNKLFDFEFWSQTWTGFYGALLFTLFIFFLSERVFREHDVSGVWIMEMNIQLSTTIAGYQLGYKLYLLKKGVEVIGSGEKIFEVDNEQAVTEFLPFNSQKIVMVDVNGYFGKRYWKRDVVRLFIKEDGSSRTSLTVVNLKVKNENELFGSYTSSAASSCGEVVLRRSLA